MTMNADDIEAAVFYRKQKAHTTFKEAEEMIALSHWNLAFSGFIMLLFIWRQLYC